MRLNRLKLVGRYKSIVGTEQQPFIYTFKPNSEGYSPICLVGLNGSGKSNFIELIADIFGYADRYFNPQYECTEDLTYDFEIDYQTIVDGHDFFIKVKSISSKVKMYSYPGLEYIDFLSFGNVQENRFQAMAVTTTIDNEYHKFLPDNVLAYSSGNNQGLSSVFAKTQLSFYNVVRKQGVFHREYAKRFDNLMTLEEGLNEKQIVELREYISNSFDRHENLFNPPVLFEGEIDIDFPLASIKAELPIGKFTDHTSNQLFFVSLMVNQNEEFKRFLAEYINISTLDSFEIDLRLSEYRDLDFIKDEALRLQQLSCDSSKFNDETLNGVLRFDVNQDFFEKIETLYLERSKFLDNLMFISQMVAKRWSRDEKRTLKTSCYERNVPNIAGGLAPIRFVNTKVRLINPNTVTLYDRLSDGEHQLIQIIGSLILFGDKQSLFILDEPESHFNPEWRIEFVDIINNYVGLSNLELIISTHSPFVLSACKSERVLHFQKNPEGCVAIQSMGNVETYGASFDSLLASVFDLDVLISKKPLSELRAGLRAYDEGFMDEQETLEWLESYGDSFEVNFRRNQLKHKLSDNGRGDE
ncbi:AAA family ATPase [Vibrio vulnificus]|uniref:AAA family ATPase n=1 Tax=Vibrio vulnificus TaxID=672 RepID=UPI0024DF381B|nr:AAA family ATPase [Vibrio vulnificus]ELV8757590.1 AAA family ATPase [Vibrio vulnificus]MDK2602524.1 AAA family ATPase [Vibrio vulnificus]MDK2641860.1 AAA family ATPase [Vibrio vulnificus]MDK2668156.1 AAA family ATPase [Vibrio vulnificus]MDK2719073.1 AAA family ATPase [Vibrio vulnificus]